MILRLHFYISTKTKLVTLVNNVPYPHLSTQQRFSLRRKLYLSIADVMKITEWNRVISYFSWDYNDLPQAVVKLKYKKILVLLIRPRLSSGFDMHHNRSQDDHNHHPSRGKRS